MRITLTADIHVGVPGKLDHIMWALHRIREYNREHGISTWINLGDITHDREVLNIRDLNVLTAFLEETAGPKYRQRLVAFPGNHDMFLKNSWDINSLRPLSPYIEVYSSISKLEIGGIRFWILPFVHYESVYMKYLAAIEKRRRDGDVLLTHIGVKNSTLNMCFMLQSWSVVDFTNSGFDRVYTGHFHIQQQVGNNLWYPGSPIPFKFDEGDSDHGFYVFDTETRTHEFIDLWEIRPIDEHTPPKYFTLDDETLDDGIIEQVKGNMVRVALSKEYTTNQLLDLKKRLEGQGAKDVKWLTLKTKEEREAILATQQKVSRASDLFERWARADKDGTKGLSIEALLKFNREIVSEGDRRYEYANDDE